jgi:NAD(P)-dependent dehydrogenase (short-subunit alcohol dehydrogenase family)
VKNYAKKTVWITGASKGIGNALVRRYLKAGFCVIASSRSISDASFPDLKYDKSRLDFFCMDVTKKEDNLAAVAHIMNTHGQLDVAILNAGSNEYVTIDDFNSDVFRQLFNTNFLSVVYALEALFPVMKETRGTIGVMGSVVGYGGLPRASAYGATKAALRNMVQALQIDLFKFPLHLSLISPGFVKTPLTDLNDFKMPFIISAEKAADRIFKGLSKNKLEIHFPLRMSLLLKFMIAQHGRRKKMSAWTFKLFNAVGYYVAWFGLIYYGSKPDYWKGIVIALIFTGIHFLCSKNKKEDLSLMFKIVAIGLCVDGLLTYAGLFKFSDLTPHFILPIWMFFVWVIFSLILNYSLAWLQRSKALACLMGALFAPTSYYSGYKLGAVDFPNITFSLAVVAVVWSILLPFLVYVSAKEPVSGKIT